MASSGAGRRMGSPSDGEDNFAGDSKLNGAMSTVVDSNSPMTTGLEKISTAMTRQTNWRGVRCWKI